MRKPIKHGLYDPAAEHDACGVGFVADLGGAPSHGMMEMGLDILSRLTHRGATGANPTTGDGAGVLSQIPDKLFRRWNGDLPPPGEYGVGMLFMPQAAAAFSQMKTCVEEEAANCGLPVLGWRKTPVNRAAINDEVADSEPSVWQVFVGPGDTGGGDAFERRLYVARKLIEHRAAKMQSVAEDAAGFYCASFSSRTAVYKGMFLASQLGDYYPDLQDGDFETRLCLVHQRFSTNTFPAWSLAHPYRLIAHNGEINTLRGNINNMTARHHSLSSELFGDDLEKIWPLIVDGQSDTASLDNAVELLIMAGYSPAHALAVLIPESWQGNLQMPATLRDFYAYHAPMMEPWDGPAEVVCCDGRQIAAVLDRNGLRPGRYWLTDDDWVVMASEAGVADIDDKKIRRKWRIQPGKILLVDVVRGRLIEDGEIKKSLADGAPYRRWRARAQLHLNDICGADAAGEDLMQIIDDESFLRLQKNFAYTKEDGKFILSPMTEDAAEPIGSMGDDAPLAALSHNMKPLTHYFRQEFAQVTNPPIDPIREEIVMSLDSYLGARSNILSPFAPPQTACLMIDHPVLTPAQFARVRELNNGRFTARGLDATYPVAGDLAAAAEKLCAQALAAVQEGANILVISDRAVSAARIAMPMLLAVSAVHSHLVREGERTKTGLVAETGAVREVHDFAALAGFGAEAVYPYLAYRAALSAGVYKTDSLPPEARLKNYRTAVGKGLLKIMSKMGVSTFQSYCGAQIFEAVGLEASLVDKYFPGTVSQIGGLDIDGIARESVFWHEQAFAEKNGAADDGELASGGDYAYRTDGEAHLWSPQSVSALQHAVRKKSYRRYGEYAALINQQAEKLMTLRGMLEIQNAPAPIPLSEVESEAAIVQRFSTGAMSFGSLSREAHTTLAIAMNRIHGKSNTGEGGEEADRFVPLANGDSMRSAIKQVASGRFGVTAEYLANSDIMQIKIAQGAKPGEGGQLPGHKVDAHIAKVRHSVPGVGLVSPPPHHDIYSIEDIAQLIYDLKCANPEGLVSVKLVSRYGVGTVAAGVVKAKSDHVTIAGYDGGTGASPISSIKRAGTPWELGLSETHQTLVLNNLRGRVCLQVDGQIKTGRDVVVGALLGADEFGFATAPLVAEGCVMMRKCHLNVCPVGIATQDETLRRKFAGRPEHVINYFFFVASEVRELLAQMGSRKLEDIIGRADLLRQKPAAHWKARGIDLSPLLQIPNAPPQYARRHCERQQHNLDSAIDRRWMRKAMPAIESGKTTAIKDTINNTQRTAGTLVSFEIARRHGHVGLADGTLTISLQGVGGQSFGAFASRGMTMKLQGEANDYFGKGLSGGILAVYPPPDSGRVDGDNIIVGNTALYGAICGECYCRGVAGERFAVRNSGAHAVIEGAGDHCCEYMTGGTVVVLGGVGRNFAAGMSGGVAYVLDDSKLFADQCNPTTVSLQDLQDAPAPGQHLGRCDVDIVQELLQKHIRYTGSARAKFVLNQWESCAVQFVKVIPDEYRRALLELHRAEEGKVA